MTTTNRLATKAQTTDAVQMINIDQCDIIDQWPAAALLATNLAALTTKDRALATKVEQSDILTGYALVVCADGAMTYCQQDETGARHWLGEHTLPIVFSENNVEKAAIEHINIALQYINDGYEALAILKNASPYQALFVIESEIPKIRMAFELHDFSAYINSGRLVIIHDAVLTRSLDQFYNANQGYNLIKKTLSFHTRDPKGNHHFSERITEAMQITHNNVVLQINDITMSINKYYASISPAQLKQSLNPNSGDKRCAINITNTYNMQDKYSSRDILSSLQSANFETKWSTYDQPDQISLLQQLKKIDTHHPNLFLLIDVFPLHTNIKLPNESITATFIHSLNDDTVASFTEAIKALANNNFIFSSDMATVKLIQKHAPFKNHIHYLPLVTNCDIYHTGYDNTNDYHKNSCDILFLGDRASDQPKNYNITLPTHQTFWQHLINVIAEAPENYYAQDAYSIVVKAQAHGIPIKKDEIRKQMASLLVRHLGKSVLWDLYLYQLKLTNLRVDVWGHTPFLPIDATNALPAYWDESIAKQCVKGTVSDGEDFNALLNQCRIFIDINDDGKPNQAVLNACAAGTFVMIKSHPNDNQPGGWGDYLDIGTELITFTSPEDMLAKVSHYLNNGQERLKIGSAAQRKCISLHNSDKRGETMLRQIHENL